VSEVRDRVQVAPVESGDAEEQRWRLLQAVSGFLRNASLVQPLLIILEDLHDADRGTLDLLVHLSRNLDGARLLLVGTYRDIEVDRGHPLSSALAELRRGQNFLRVPLRGLTAEEVQRMMASVSQREIPWPFAELVHRQTEGNPLFVQEMLRYLVEEGLVSEQGGSLRRVGDDTLAGRIPEGLRDVIGKRLSRLSDKTNQVLAIASVVGREFRLDVLQRVAGLPVDDVEAALEQAAGVAVVEQRQATGTLGFRFTHAFFRQTLYEEIFVPRRIRLHQQVARALVVAYGRRAEEHAAELAEHFAQTTDREDLEQALRYSRVAAERAMSVYAYSDAVRHLDQALKVQEVLDPDDVSTRCDLLLALGEALLPAGDPARVASAIAPEAVVLAETAQEGKQASHACQLALEALWMQGGIPVFTTTDFQRWVERAERHAVDGSLDRVLTQIARARIANYSNRQLEAQKLAEGAMALARTLNEDEALTRAAGLLLVMRLPGVQQSRLALADEFSERAQLGASLAAYSGLLHLLEWTFLANGRREQAEEILRRIEDIAKRTKASSSLASASLLRLQLATIDGRLEEALDLGQQLTLRAGEVGVGRFAPRAAAIQLMRTHFYLGRVAEELSSSRDSTEGSDTRGGSHTFSSERALDLAYAGRLDEVRALLLRLCEDLGAGDSLELSYPLLTSYLEAAVLVADSTAAGLIIERLAPSAGMIDEMYDTCIARHLGAASELLGNREQARHYYEQALEVAGKVRFRPEIALTHLRMAELLLAEADSNQPSAFSTAPPTRRGKQGGLTADKLNVDSSRAEALAHLDFAIAEFREMKMQPALERALRHKEVLKA